VTTPQLLSGWGRTAPTRADVVGAADVSDVVAAVRDGPSMVARGLGRAYGDAAQNAGGRVIDMRGMRRVLEFDHDQGLVTAEAGLDLDSLIKRVLPHGWFVPVTPGTRYVTLGGALACDIHGKNHHVDGSFAQHVEAFELVTPAGTVRWLKRGEDEPLFWATAGGMGLTGVVTAVQMRLLPVESAYMRVTTARAASLDRLVTSMRERDDDFRYAVAWIDCLKRGADMGRGILIRGDHATAAELPPRLGRRPLRYVAPVRLAVPDAVPSGLLNGLTARAFNAVWYGMAPARERTGYEGLAAFFHPLDAVSAWNRLYGRRGFVQYQAVVPEADTVRALLERVSRGRTSSFLAVLKRFGAGSGLLSFPMPGWTLALDIPAGAPRLASVLDELDELVVAARGRVYLAKDARVRPELLSTMYPELPRWQAIQREVDPEGTMRSDLAQRLGLTESR
jgi:decaprenylphospho-beta-D-ribofuranose 2-oxidase